MIVRTGSICVQLLSVFLVLELCSLHYTLLLVVFLERTLAFSVNIFQVCIFYTIADGKGPPVILKE